MPQNYVIQYSTNGGSTWTTMADVQSISASIGKQSFIDPWRASSMTFVARYPNGYFNPNTALVTGTPVKLFRANSAGVQLGYEMWRGLIASVEVSWGLPYNTTTKVGNADYVTVVCEGALAGWGRAQGNNYSVVSGNAYYQLADVSFASGYSVGTTYSPTSAPMVGAATVSESYADWLNTFAVSLGATIKDGGPAPSGGGPQVGVYTKDFIGTLSVGFSDTTNNASNQVYENVTLTSEVENYFTQITVQTASYGNVSANYGSSPYRTLSLSTYNSSAAQATDLANYYLAVYQTPTIGIKTVTCRSEAQTVWNLDLGYSWYDILGYRTNLTFRGITYYMSIIGSTFQATPETSTFTYYLASAAYLPFFILNSAEYGVLGTNKLSW